MQLIDAADSLKVDLCVYVNTEGHLYLDKVNGLVKIGSTSKKDSHPSSSFSSPIGTQEGKKNCC